MYRVVHVMPHMGPGVGKAVSAVARCAKQHNSKFKHEILLLEEPQNTTYIDLCKSAGVQVYYNAEQALNRERLASADIVQLEWWHHPLMLGWIQTVADIPMRLTIWSHISGCNYPILPADFISLPEHFFLTTEYSFENQFWSVQEQETNKKLASVAYGTGGFDALVETKVQPHVDFNIGYMGTLDFCKLNPQFMEFCKEVNIPEACFILVGNDSNKGELERQAVALEITNRFEFTGFSKDIPKELARMDVFGYLLNPKHFGATDNALLEAMAAGLAIIVLNQCGEKHVIKHGETGVVVNNPCEYGAAVRYLYENPQERKRLGANARASVFDKFSVANTVEKLHGKYEQIIDGKKCNYDFSMIFGKKPYEWFLAGLGEERQLFENSIMSGEMQELERQIFTLNEMLRGETKSSISHFYSYYQDDETLRILTAMLKKEG